MSVTPVDPDRSAPAAAAMVALRRADHTVVCAVAALHADGLAADLGYRSTARYLEDFYRVDPGQARRWVARAALLAPRATVSAGPLPPVLPATAATAAEGVLDDAHLRVIATTMDHLARVPGLAPDEFADAEAFLAEHARTLAPRGLEKVAVELVNRLDPDGAAPPENGPPTDELHLLTRRDRTLRMAGTITGRAEAAVVAETFDRLSAPAGPDDTRPLAQRRAEALVDLCTQANAPGGIAHDSDAGRTQREDGDQADLLDGDEQDHSRDGHNDEPRDDGEEPGGDGEEPGEDGEDGVADGEEPDLFTNLDPPEQPCTCTGARRAQPLIMITIDHHWLRDQTGHARLDTNDALSPSVARRLACDAGILPAVLGGPSEPLDLGRTRYLVTDTQRRALTLRDRGCTFPGCTRRPRRCHAHHITHWTDGGETNLPNLTLLCRYHHHLIHHDHWSITMTNSRPWYTPPPTIDPTRTPRPGGPG